MTTTKETMIAITKHETHSYYVIILTFSPVILHCNSSFLNLNVIIYKIMDNNTSLSGWLWGFSKIRLNCLTYIRCSVDNSYFVSSKRTGLRMRRYACQEISEPIGFFFFSVHTIIFLVGMLIGLAQDSFSSSEEWHDFACFTTIHSGNWHGLLSHNVASGHSCP